MKTILMAGVALSVAITATAASAAPQDGWYGAIDAGVHDTKIGRAHV